MKPDTATFTFSQDADDCTTKDICWQYLKVCIENGGAGPFIAIETDRWAMDVEEIDEFANLLKSLVKQVKSEEEWMAGKPPTP